MKDFANYKPEWVKPIGKVYRGYTLHETPPNCDAPRWRYNASLEINVEAAMDAGTLQALSERGHRTEVINDSYQDFGAGQFIWRAGGLKVEGYVVASDPRRDGQAFGF